MYTLKRILVFFNEQIIKLVLSELLGPAFSWYVFYAINEKKTNKFLAKLNLSTENRAENRP